MLGEPGFGDPAPLAERHLIAAVHARHSLNGTRPPRLPRNMVAIGFIA